LPFTCSNLALSASSSSSSSSDSSGDITDDSLSLLYHKVMINELNSNKKESYTSVMDLLLTLEFGEVGFDVGEIGEVGEVGDDEILDVIGLLGRMDGLLALDGTSGLLFLCAFSS
jgi:hypothetical protein